MKFCYAFAIVIVLLFSCKKEGEQNLNSSDYLVFGHFYGMCQGETRVETYKLTSTALYEDTEDSYSHYSFNYEELSNTQFNEVKDLATLFPDALWDEEETTFGCPDCMDQGGIYVEYKKDGQLVNWLFDNVESNNPSYAGTFITEVKNKIDYLSN